MTTGDKKTEKYAYGKIHITYRLISQVVEIYIQEAFSIMKKFTLAMFLIVLMCGAAFAGKQNFKLINYSGQTITAVYVSPSFQDKYKPQDKFTGGGIPVRNGDYVTLNFTPTRNTNVRYWDMRVFFPDGDYWNWSKLDLLNIYEITIDEDGTIHYRTIN